MNKPIIAAGDVIPSVDFEALYEEAEESRAARRALLAYQAWQADPATGEPWEVVKLELGKTDQP